MQKVETMASVRLPDEVVDYLQSLDYEIGGLQVLHTHALNAGAPAEKVAELQARFQEKYSEYQLAKQEAFAAHSGEHRSCRRWWVNFQEGVMYFEG